MKWYAFKIGPAKFGIFDTFSNEAGRNAHLTGDIAKALGARASELFAVSPQVGKVEILAQHTLKAKWTAAELQLLGVHMFRYVATILVAILLSAPSWRESRRFRPAFTRKWFRRTAPASTSESAARVRPWCCCMASADTGDMWAPWQLFWPTTIP